MNVLSAYQFEMMRQGRGVAGPNRESESTYTTELVDCGRVRAVSSDLERVVRNLEQVPGGVAGSGWVADFA